MYRYYIIYIYIFCKMSIWKNVITIQGLTRSWSVNNCRVDIESEVYYDLWLWIPQIWEICNFYPFLPPWVGLPCHLLICTNVNYLLHWCRAYEHLEDGVKLKWSVLKYSIERPGFGVSFRDIDLMLVDSAKRYAPNSIFHVFFGVRVGFCYSRHWRVVANQSV